MEGRKFLSVLLLFFLCTASPLFGKEPENGATGEILPPTRIFYLDSYGRDYEWSREIQQGLQEGLRESSKNVELSVEHLDHRRFPEKAYQEIFASYLEAKYAGYSHDLLLLSDNPAFDFVMAHRERLFPKVPVAFCGYNNLTPEEIAPFKNITGINEEISLSETVRIIRLLQPSLRHLVAITSTGNETDRRNARLVQRLPEVSGKNVTLQELRDVTLQELEEVFASLPPQTAVLIAGQLRDEPRPEVSARRIAEASPFPVYSQWDFSMGTGVVGGDIIRGYDQGYALAQLALQIMEGESPEDIPPVMRTPTTPMFDWNALKRHGIPRKRLPKGALLLNPPMDINQIWKVYRREFLLGLALLFFLCLIILLLSMNIGKRKRAEETLRKKEIQLRHISDSLEKGFLYQMDFGPAGVFRKILYVSAGVRDVLGVSPEEIYEDPGLLYRYLHPEDLADFMEEEFGALEDLRPFNVETRLLLPEGSVKWVHIVSVGYREKNGHILRNGLVLDISSFKEIQSDKELLENLVGERTAALETAALEAVRANRAKSVFLANMSHEIRTPLNAILGFATILERDPSISPKQRDALRTISRSGKHLLELINDILSMSKIEAGKLSLHTAPFSPSQLLEDLASVFRSQAASKGVAFEVEKGEALPQQLLGDEAKVRQICVNLLGNAVKFTQEGNIVLKAHTEKDDRKESLREGIREDAQEEKSLYLVVEVKDTGPGIPSEELPRIFEAFRQAEGGEHAGGTGLGLSITKSLVQFMGGAITAESTLGEGSSFRFRIPLKESTLKESDLPNTFQLMAKLEQNREPVRILVVDDSRDNREFLRALLEPQGFLLMEGTNGIEALEMLESWEPHLILMDIRMPLMDGYEAIRKIRKNPAHGDLPVIAVTARSFEEDAQAIRLAGATDYLSKPFTPESLFALLGKYLNLEDALHQEQQDFSSLERERSLSREDLAKIPRDLLSSMKQAVHEGDMKSLEELVREVQQLDSLRGAQLQDLLEQYDYEKLQLLLE